MKLLCQVFLFFVFRIFVPLLCHRFCIKAIFYIPVSLSQEPAQTPQIQGVVGILPPLFLRHD